ncbi:universal stress protein, partial [Parabacteroides distasonis]
IDVIALSTYRRNILARMFNPSIARKMLFHTDTPLLVIDSKK